VVLRKVPQKADEMRVEKEMTRMRMTETKNRQVVGCGKGFDFEMRRVDHGFDVLDRAGYKSLQHGRHGLGFRVREDRMARSQGV